MDARSRTASRRDKKLNETEKEKVEIQGNISMDRNIAIHRCQSRRERKLALEQDVDKLKRKLRHEENVHRALERAFTRPLGALPRLPPYLPTYTLELLAEVAVLEEEVVRLEEQVVSFRQGLYKEAIYISSSNKSTEKMMNLYCDRHPFDRSSKNNEHPEARALTSPNDKAFVPLASTQSPADAELGQPSSNRSRNARRPLKKPNLSSAFSNEQYGKENQLNANFSRNVSQSQLKKVSRLKTPISIKKWLNPQAECVGNGERSEEGLHWSPSAVPEEGSCPNKLSEDILKCLTSIFSRINSQRNVNLALEFTLSDISEGIDFRDPYGICKEFGRRDIGPYKHLCTIEANSVDWNLVKGSSFLTRRLKVLLGKLALVDLAGLAHQQKLAFWINIYNSCTMNAVLEQGMPASPQMVVELMPKAMINVGGQLLSAMTIEHFILRLPYHSKYMNLQGSKNDEVTTRGVFGLDWPEPLVTFALSCGSWSSPAVRVYTASQVEKELEKATRNYLQAAIGLSVTGKLAIPKLLDWYLLDFAKDLDGLMDWICLQLPSELRNNAVQCLENGRKDLVPQPVQILPYDFSFRYLLAS